MTEEQKAKALALLKKSHVKNMGGRYVCIAYSDAQEIEAALAPAAVTENEPDFEDGTECYWPDGKFLENSAPVADRADNDLRDEIDFIWRWIERMKWDDSSPMENQLNVLIHSPYAPWKKNRELWDTKHKSYDAEIDAAVAKDERADKLLAALKEIDSVTIDWKASAIALKAVKQHEAGQ